MKANIKRLNYSQEEDNIILREIQKNPENLTEAFESASDKITLLGLRKCNEHNVRQRYYTNLRDKYPIFTLEGGKDTISNTKIVQKGSKFIRVTEKRSAARLAREYKKLSAQEKINFQVLIK